MKDEIKEILDNIKIVIDEGHYRATCDIDYEDCKILYNYITNLQEELEDLRRILGIWNNRKLINKFNKEYDKEDKNKNPNRNYVAIYPDAEEVYKRYYDYKSRNEKAREYINKEKYVSADENCEIIAGYHIDELLNILNGDDE